MMSGVPTMWNALLHAPAGANDKEDFATLRLAASEATTTMAAAK